MPRRLDGTRIASLGWVPALIDRGAHERPWQRYSHVTSRPITDLGKEDSFTYSDHSQALDKLTMATGYHGRAQGWDPDGARATSTAWNPERTIP